MLPQLMIIFHRFCMSFTRLSSSLHKRQFEQFQEWQTTVLHLYNWHGNDGAVMLYYHCQINDFFYSSAAGLFRTLGETLEPNSKNRKSNRRPFFLGRVHACNGSFYGSATWQLGQATCHIVYVKNDVNVTQPSRHLRHDIHGGTRQ